MKSTRYKEHHQQGLSADSLFLVRYSRPQLPYDIIAFGQQRIDAALSFRNVVSHVEFAVNSHVVNGVELYDVNS